ncbi:MAG TPA: SRPBCC family protein [Gemmatimonadaceae bacterium]
MWKWILGAVVLVVLLIGSGMWYGFRKMSQLANGDSTVTVTIGGAPERVFASLANGDSIGDWMVGGRVRPSRGGQLRQGDTLYVEQRDSTRAQHMAWVVGDVVPNKSFALQLVADTLNVVAVSRRYTVMGQGDSTVIFSTVTSPMMDSVKRAESRGKNSAMMEFASKMMVGAMRMQNQMELKQLKARVEGVPVGNGAPAVARP